MLKRISIQNFKGIGPRVDIDLRPVTLLFGPNSAGKSTILHAIHYAHALLESGHPDVGRTRLGGAMDLGGFQQLIHDHDLNNEILLGFVLTPEPEGALGNAAEYLQHEFETVAVEFRIRWSTFLQHPIVDRCRIAFDDEHLAELGCGLDGANVWLTDINLANPVLGSELEDDEPTVLSDRVSCLPGRRMALPRIGKSLMLEGQRRQLKDRLDIRERSRSVSGSRSGGRTHSVSGSGTGDGSGYGDGYGSGWGDGSGPGFGRPVDPDDEFYALLDDLVTSAVEALRDQLERFRYVGPVRQSPPRHYHAPKQNDESRWAHGLGAWDALVRDEELRDQTSRWLAVRSRFDTGYRIQWRSYREVDDETFYRMQVAARNFELDETFLALTSQLQHRGRLVVLDESKNLELAPCDLGEGIGQVVPVITAALARTLMTPGGHEEKTELVAIEQPELHIHPRMQVVLGDLFLSQCSERQFLIETHSEHLMLRLLRRVRETSEGELPADVPEASVDTVAVYYVEQDNGAVKLTELRISEDGDFADPWPQGFFAERRRELF
ncbi:MAG: DUF3696 domain-containing protein [Deltaproteobacteria bacterium]|nr:DUF3696 domain-containing protein [Deltaproteobacteria bacterium]